MLYHGSTHKFDKLDKSRSHDYNFAGPYIYLSDSEYDSAYNYGGVGPDLSNRISDYSCNNDCEVEEAKEILVGCGHYLYVCSLLGDNVFVVGDHCEEPEFVVDEEGYDDYDEAYCDAVDEYLTNHPLYCAVEEYATELLSETVEYLMGDMSSYKYYEVVQEHACEGFSLDIGYEEAISATHILAVLCELSGYDAIKFEDMSQYLGMYDNIKASHTVVFDNDKVKIEECRVLEPNEYETLDID